MSSPTPPSPTSLPFADSTPLGLLGLAIGCAALVPVAFGVLPADPAKLPMFFKTTAWFCLLFGAGGQLLAGLMALANKNSLGGTLFTTFAFNWVLNWWAFDEAAQGRAFDASVGFAADVAFLLIFVVLTYAFAFFSKALFFFLLDIDVLYGLRIVKHLVPSAAGALGVGVGVATVLLMGLALYIAFALLVNPAAGRAVFPTSGPLLKATPVE
jgi:succinate-acetate transporter protein